jgi:hypothetical protein
MSDYEQGYESGQRFVADVLRKQRRGIGRGEEHDLIQLAADGHVPDDVIEQIEERVPVDARVPFEPGFMAACRNHVARRDLGMDDN